MKFAVIVWKTRCHHCGHLHEHEQQNADVGLEFQPEPVPRRCDECNGTLSNTPHAYHQTFEVVEVVD